MAEKKRGHYYDNRSQQQPHKKHKPNSYSSANNRNFAPSRQPEPDIPGPNYKVALLSLLDHLILEEENTEQSSEIVDHARKLQELLSARAGSSLPSQVRQELDQRRPEQYPQKPVPPYTFPPLPQGQTLPPLPEIGDSSLKEATFRHRSTRTAHESDDDLTYERLEFLGDAYIEIISTRLIYSRFPRLETGKQAQLREALVRNEQLARFANAYKLGDRIVHSGQEDKEKGWTKILADVFEAYVAAVILADIDGGFSRAEKWLTELWAQQLLEYKEKVVENPDAKNEIARLVGYKGIKIDYRATKPMVHINGVQHFYIGCYLTGWGYTNKRLGTGEGQSKSQAGIAAAADALRHSKDVLDDAHAKKMSVVGQRRLEAEATEKAVDSDLKSPGDIVHK